MPWRETMHAIGEGRSTFPFIERRWRAWTLSIVLIVVATGSLFVRGLNLGIDFEGGTSFLVPTEGVDASVDGARDVLAGFGLADAKVSILGGDTIRVQAEELEPGSTTFVVVTDEAGPGLDVVEEAVGSVGVDLDVDGGEGQVTVVVARELDEVDQRVVTDALTGIEGVEADEVTVDRAVGETEEVASALADYGGVDVSEVSISEIGPTFGREVAEKARDALIFFFVAVAAYLTLRFKGNWKMAAAALFAVVHDILVTVGVYSVTGFEVTPATVIAFLTILGFSLYDTVVVFDKVAENVERLGSVGRETYSDVVDRSMNQVLARSLSTSFVAILPVLSLLVIGTWVLGAPTLSEFALALFVGLVAGTYSSIFVAAPVLTVWKEREPRFRELRARVEARVAAEPSSRPEPEPATGSELEPEPASTPAGHGVEPGAASSEPRDARQPSPDGVITPRGRKRRGKRRRR